MAELGPDAWLGLHGNDVDVHRVKVSVEMMDYGYVKGCDSVSELRAILKTLVTGEYGRYPDLEDFVRNKLVALLPERERQRYRAVTASSNKNHNNLMEEAAREKEDLDRWLQGIDHKEEDLTDDIFESTAAAAAPSSSQSFSLSSSKYYPPVRTAGRKTHRHNAAAANSTTAPTSSSTSASRSTSKGISSSRKERIPDTREYYRSWDALDYDAMERDTDDFDEDEKLLTSTAAAAPAASADVAPLRSVEDVSSFSRTERIRMAQTEKQKGNEFYRVGEYEHAVVYYTRSLQLLFGDETETPSNVNANVNANVNGRDKFLISANDLGKVVYANRAAASLKLRNFKCCQNDCDAALRIDPSYVKARARRATVHHHRGHYDEAIDDWTECLRSDETSKVYRRALQRAQRKRDEVMGDTHTRTRTRIVITDDDEDEDDHPNEKTIDLPVKAKDQNDRPTDDRIEPQKAKTTSKDHGNDNDDDSMVVEEIYTPGALEMMKGNTQESTVTNDDPKQISNNDNNVNNYENATMAPPQATTISNDNDNDNGNDRSNDKEDATTNPDSLDDNGGFHRVQIVEVDESSDDEDDDDDKNDELIPPQIVPNNNNKAQAERWKEEGNCAMKERRYEDAVKWYSKVVDNGPDRVAMIARNNRAQAYLFLGEPAKAEEDATVCICEEGNQNKNQNNNNNQTNNHSNAKAWYRRAVARLRLSRPREAAQDFEKVLILDPRNREAKNQLRKLSLSRGREPDDPPPPPPPPPLIVPTETKQSSTNPPCSNLDTAAKDKEKHKHADTDTDHRAKIADASLPSPPPRDSTRNKDGKLVVSSTRSSSEKLKVPADASSKSSINRDQAPTPTPTPTPTKLPLPPRPQSSSEMEYAIQGLLKQPSRRNDVLPYLRRFRRRDFQKWFTATLHPDVLNTLFGALRPSVVPGTNEYAPAKIHDTRWVLHEIARVAPHSLEVPLLCMDASGKAALGDILRALDADPDDRRNVLRRFAS